MKYLSNIYNPIGETQERAWKDYQQWLEGKVIGRPQATETYSIEELERMNYVGVYINDDE